MNDKRFSKVDSGITVEEWVPSTCGLCSIGCGLEIARAPHGGRQQDREALVIEKALGRPELLRANKTVIALLSGLEPEVSPPAKAAVVEQRKKRQWAVEPGDAEVEIPRSSSSKAELDYIEALFDFRTLAHWW